MYDLIFLFTVKFASKRSVRRVTTDLGGYSQRLQSTACGQATNTKIHYSVIK